MTVYSGDRETLGKRSQESIDEKKLENNVETAVLDATEGDEALLIVGAERTVEFSEEFNLKLRRKLVSSFPRRRLYDS